MSLEEIVTKLGTSVSDIEGAQQASVELGKEIKVSKYAAVRRKLGLKKKAGRPRKVTA